MPLSDLWPNGMYDNATVYDALAAHQDGAAIDIVVPPRRTAALSPTAQSAPTQRDQHIADTQYQSTAAPSGDRMPLVHDTVSNDDVPTYFEAELFEAPSQQCAFAEGVLQRALSRLNR